MHDGAKLVSLHTSTFHCLLRMLELVGMMLAWVFSFDLTIGPLAYCIVGEVSSTRLRNKTVGLSRISYNVFAIGFGVMTPYELVSTDMYFVAILDPLP